MKAIKAFREKLATGTPLALLTAYDASMAAAQQCAGIDAILVGDSLGMVIQGHHDTIPVTLENIIYHCSAVKRGAPDTLLIADIPFMAATTTERLFAAVQQLMQIGNVDMIKLEGSGADTLDQIQALYRIAVPVCAHIGVQPQQIRLTGSYTLQANTQKKADDLFRQAQRLKEAGAQMVILECLPAELGARICHDWSGHGAVIGIGSGSQCHGQILVSYDVLGISNPIPSFAHNFLSTSAGVQDAFANYALAVREGRFPAS